MDHTLVNAIGGELLESTENYDYIFCFYFFLCSLQNSFSPFQFNHPIYGTFLPECIILNLLLQNVPLHSLILSPNHALIIFLLIGQETLVLSLVPPSTMFYHPHVQSSTNLPILWDRFPFNLLWAWVNKVALLLVSVFLLFAVNLNF